MVATHLYVNEIEINTRLSAFDATREELINVVREVVGARADAVDDDPITAAGLFAYIHGTRNTRALFRSKGWRHERRENIEAVRHPDRNLKVIYQSVDVACDEKHVPQAISGKGSGAERAIDQAQGSLFADSELDAVTFKPVTAPAFGFSACPSMVKMYVQSFQKLLGFRTEISGSLKNVFSSSARVNGKMFV